MAFDHDRILRDAFAALAKAEARRTRRLERGRVVPRADGGAPAG